MTAQKDYALTAYAGGANLSYNADFWDTLRAQWGDQSKLDPSTWTNPPTGAKRITSPAVGQFVLEQNTGTPAAPVWTVRFTFDSTANTTAITAASNAAATAQATANAALPISGGTMTGYIAGSGATGISSIAAVNGDVNFSVRSYGNTPAAMTFHRVGLYAGALGLDTDNKLKFGGWSMGANAYEIWHAGNSYQVKGMAYSGGQNTGSGANVFNAITSGFRNTAFGQDSQSSVVQGNTNSSYGFNSGKTLTQGSNNSFFGSQAGHGFTTQAHNCCFGESSGFSSTAESACMFGNSAGATTGGVGSVYIGFAAGASSGTKNYMTALGYFALYGTDSYNNCTGVGANSKVTAANQVQLGDSATTTYAYGAVQNRSDIRDKTDVQPTDLGLDFINALKPVKARWDYREDYRQPMPERPSLEEPREPTAPVAPTPPPEGASDEALEAYEQALKAYEQAMAEYKQALEDYQQALKAYEQAMAEYEADRLQWLEDSKLKNIKRDGSKARSRHHQMLIAQDVQAVCTAMDVDFGGLQDHSLSGGDDVMSLGYEEFIPVLIKAMQELTIKNAALEARLTAAGI